MPPKSTPSRAGQRSRSPRRSQRPSAGAQSTGNVDNEHLPNLRARVSGSYGGQGKADLPGDMARSGQTADFATELENEAHLASHTPSIPAPDSEYQGPSTRSRTGSPVKETAPISRRKTSAANAPHSARTSARTTAANMSSIPEDSSPISKATMSGRADTRHPTSGATALDQSIGNAGGERSFNTEGGLNGAKKKRANAHAALSNRNSDTNPNGSTNTHGNGNIVISSTKKIWQYLWRVPSFWESVVVGFLVLCVTSMIGCAIVDRTSLRPTGGDYSLCLSAPLDTLKFYWGWANVFAFSFFNSNGTQMVKMLKAYDSRLHALEQSDHASQQSIEYITSQIPDWVMRRGKKGDVQLTDEFWRAVKEKAEIDTSIDTGAGAWAAFYKNNENTIDVLLHKGVRDKVRWHVESGELLSRVQITNMLQVHARQLRELIQTKFDEIHKYPEIQEYAMKQAKMTVDSTLANSPASFAHLMATASLLFSQNLSLTQVNYASWSIGAYIQRRLTSPTAPAHDPFWRKFMRAIITRRPNPPVTALLPWTEGGQCWCTAQAKKTDPQAQLSIHLATSVYLKTFTLEHIPKSGTLDPHAVPKDIELWADIPNADERARVRGALPTGLDTRGDKLTARRGWIYWLRAIGTLPRDLVVGTDISTLPDTYVRVLKDRYLHDSTNFVQMFDIGTNADFYGLNVTVRDVIVRATTNYGGPYTCIYRVRVGGPPGLVNEPLETPAEREPGEVHPTDVEDRITYMRPR